MNNKVIITATLQQKYNGYHFNFYLLNNITAYTNKK